MDKMTEEELAADAANLLASPAVDYALSKLQEEYLQVLIQADVGTLTATAAHASIRALADLKYKLAALARQGNKLNAGKSR